MASAARVAPFWTRRLKYDQMSIVTLAFSSHLKKERDAFLRDHTSFEAYAAHNEAYAVPDIQSWAECLIEFPDQKDGRAGVHIAHWRKVYPTSWWDRFGFAKAAAFAIVTTAVTAGAINWLATLFTSVVLASMGLPAGIICGMTVLFWRVTRAVKESVPVGLISSIEKIALAASDMKGTAYAAYEWCKNKVKDLSYMGFALIILSIYSVYALVRLYFFPYRDCVVLESKEEDGKKRIVYKPATWLEQTEQLLVYSTMACALSSAYLRVAKIVGWHNAFFRVIDFFTGKGPHVEAWWTKLWKQEPMFVRASSDGLGFNDSDFDIPQSSAEASAAMDKPKEIDFFERSKKFFWDLIIQDGWQLIVLAIIIGAQYMIYRRMEEIRKQCERLNKDTPEAPALTYHWFRAHYAKAIKMGKTVPELVQTRWSELQEWWRGEKIALEATRIRTELGKVFQEKNAAAEKRREMEKAQKAARKKLADEEQERKTANKQKDKQQKNSSREELQKKIAALESQITALKDVTEEAKGKRRASGSLSDNLRVNDKRQDISDSKAKENERAYNAALEERMGEGRHAQQAADLIARNQGVPFNSSQFRRYSKYIWNVEHEGLKLEAKLAKPLPGSKFQRLVFSTKQWDQLTPTDKAKVKELNAYAAKNSEPQPSAAAPVKAEAVVTQDPVQTISTQSLVRVMAKLPDGSKKSSSGAIVGGMVVTVRHAFTPSDELETVVDAKDRQVMNNKWNDITVKKWYDHPTLDLSFGEVDNPPASIKLSASAPRGGNKVNVYILGATDTGIAVSTGEIRRVDNEAVLHSGNTHPGWSGAPLLVNSKLVAIHRGAAGAENTSVLLSEDVLKGARKALGMSLN